jgi:hypothetical protein
LQEAWNSCEAASEQAQQAQQREEKVRAELHEVERDLVVERKLNEELQEVMQELQHAHNDN